MGSEFRILRKKTPLEPDSQNWNRISSVNNLILSLPLLCAQLWKTGRPAAAPAPAPALAPVPAAAAPPMPALVAELGGEENRG